jgi:hypothetical protein
MSLVILKRYNNVGEALVAFSSLQAGGFNPSFHNYHHAHIAYLEMLAFGGLILLIPEQEYEHALTFVNSARAVEPLEFDPLPVRKYGRWKFALLFSMGAQGGLTIFLAMCIFIRFKFILLIALMLGVADLAFGGRPSELLVWFILFLFPVAMLLHAEYVAVPRLQRSQANEH